MKFKATFLIFVFYSILIVSYFLFVQTILINEDVLLRSLKDIDYEIVKNIFENQLKSIPLRCFMNFLLNVLRIFVVAIIIYIGIYLWGYKSKFNDVIKITLLTQFIFFIPKLILMLWFSFNISYQLVDLQIFSPISVLNLLEFDYNEKIWIYPLQLLNVFELTYWIALAYGISKLINNNFDKALKIVLRSYVPALVVWVVFVMFLTVTLNPS